MTWTRDQFQAWKESPATGPFLDYLQEQRKALADAWANGKELPEHAQAMAQVLGDLIDLEYERDVLAFYGIEPPPPEETESETVSE